MKKILIVEDAPFNTDLLVQLLEDDYELITASDGAAGLVLAAQASPDAILMDMSLPVMDGYTATRQLKADPALCHIPVIALTAHAMLGDADKVRAAGCDAYLTKPLDEAALFAALARCLGLGDKDDA